MTTVKQVFVLYLILFLTGSALPCYCFAAEIQLQLVGIATQEARIANIGANKAMMLYGVVNPIPVINQWNTIEHKPALIQEQIEQIKTLELQKQVILRQAHN